MLVPPCLAWLRGCIMTLQESSREPDLLYLPELPLCFSPHMRWWTGALYAYKGLLLIFGVYMAWETKSVQVSTIKELEKANHQVVMKPGVGMYR